MPDFRVVLPDFITTCIPVNVAPARVADFIVRETGVLKYAVRAVFWVKVTVLTGFVVPSSQWSK